ncbi:copper transporter [Kineococcus rhizosphaerae]|uniref:Copper transport outer membrane protein MctB n=1 Tax=Kineococcus rhizosphaerae TaxID=559628 RepID=A0A2T0R9D4_9ACTN|nr:copper transporter [Kineococcus rhizosphaerae]PRY17777.1 copper transport outer membrane protein MctB [Kineococcus rhizosphaerae]
MIDFRYHVVSLVSVFLALAVGIVLGAGPLNEGISTGITDQVRQLTTEKNQLRTERDAARTSVDQQDAWAEAVGPALVARQLGGRSVAVVELPGADSSQVDATIAVLQAAGAQVSVQVTVQDKWIDTTDAATADRQKAANALTAQLTTPPAADAGTPDVLAAELARAVVTMELVQSGAPDEGAQTVLKTLSDAGLVDVQDGVDPAVPRGTLALVVGGIPDTDTTDAQRSAASDAWTALARELDAAGAGTVVAGPPESAADGGVVADVRADKDLSQDVSSVDDLDSSMGRVNAVLALRQQLSGAAGQYGTADSATAVNPPLPAAAP